MKTVGATFEENFYRYCLNKRSLMDKVGSLADKPIWVKIRAAGIVEGLRVSVEELGKDYFVGFTQTGEAVTVHLNAISAWSDVTAGEEVAAYKKIDLTNAKLVEKVEKESKNMEAVPQ